MLAKIDSKMKLKMLKKLKKLSFPMNKFEFDKRSVNQITFIPTDVSDRFFLKRCRYYR